MVNLGTVQMIVTSLCGYIQLRNTQWKKPQPSQLVLQNNSKAHYSSILFWRNMTIIGVLRLDYELKQNTLNTKITYLILRLFSIVLGLMALKQATISFVETVKSSSPLFTVIISQFM